MVPLEVWGLIYKISLSLGKSGLVMEPAYLHFHQNTLPLVLSAAQEHCNSCCGGSGLRFETIQTSFFRSGLQHSGEEYLPGI